MSPCECLVVRKPIETASEFAGEVHNGGSNARKTMKFFDPGPGQFPAARSTGPRRQPSSATPGLPVLSAPPPAIRRHKIFANRSTNRPGDSVTPDRDQCVDLEPSMRCRTERYLAAAVSPHPAVARGHHPSSRHRCDRERRRNQSAGAQCNNRLPRLIAPLALTTSGARGSGEQTARRAQGQAPKVNPCGAA